jgi:signal transduction histidine kinase
MFSFFTPQLKIQKNRQVLRETDERMAKYSRRGLMGNFLIFLLCMAVGDFVEREPGLAIALTVGLLITTLLRGYLLFLFDTLYPRAPTLWRTRYFYATLLGAAWWGLIISIETLVVGISSEAPLLWLYTIVFFSMTANAFAPYKRFLTIYQLLGLVPGAFCLLFTGDMTGIIFGIVVFFFIWLLHHQCEQIADNYWERLESTDSLARKTESLEEEKRDTRATAQLHRDYMLLLKKELEEMLNTQRADRNDEHSNQSKNSNQTLPVQRPRLSQLHDNVSDFYQILTKDIEFNNRIFNPQALLHQLMSEYADAAHDKNIDIDLALSPNLPKLVLGDTERLSQILRSMLSTVINQLDEGTLFIDVEYLQERGRAGDFILTINHQPSGQPTLFNSQQITGVQLNLELALATGLAEAQQGSLGITCHNKGTQLCYRVPYPNRSAEEPHVDPAETFRGKSLLLIHENPKVLDAKRQELGMLGLAVTTETAFKKALNLLRASIHSNAPFSAIVFHCHADPKATADFSRTILNESDCKLIPQIIMGPKSCKERDEFGDIISNPTVHWIDKPAIQDDFRMCFWEIFNQEEQRVANPETNSIALVGSGNTYDKIAERLASEGYNCQHYSSTKTIIIAAQTHLLKRIIFVNCDPHSLADASSKLRESQPNLYIIACDQDSKALSHLQSGADYFVAGNEINTELLRYIKALT